MIFEEHLLKNCEILWCCEGRSSLLELSARDLGWQFTARLHWRRKKRSFGRTLEIDSDYEKTQRPDKIESFFLNFHMDWVIWSARKAWNSGKSTPNFIFWIIFDRKCESKLKFQLFQWSKCIHKRDFLLNKNIWWHLERFNYIL